MKIRQGKAASVQKKQGRERIFISLLCLVCAAACLLLFCALILPWLFDDPGWLPVFSISFGGACILAMLWLCLTLVFNIGGKCDLPGAKTARRCLAGLILPVMEQFGEWGGVDRNVTRRSFIRLNNEFVMSHFDKKPESEKLLLLLPHCIQNSTCPRRISSSLKNCANCGDCQIGHLRALSEKKGFKIAIATGGTIARRIVVECSPELIVAVACERDLTAGIQACWPIPVFGLLNERPFGPCRDTLVPVPELERCLAAFMGEDKEHCLSAKDEER